MLLTSVEFSLLSVPATSTTQVATSVAVGVLGLPMKYSKNWADVLLDRMVSPPTVSCPSTEPCVEQV